MNIKVKLAYPPELTYPVKRVYPIGQCKKQFIEYCRLIADELNVERLIFTMPQAVLGTYTAPNMFHPNRKESWKPLRGRP